MSIDKHRVQDLLARVREVRLAVVGDCMLDVYLAGSVGRISPEAPVPVVQVREERSAPGGAANVAAAAAALGAECRLVGVVGDDQAADRLASSLAALGVDGGDLVNVADRPTTTKTRVMARHQHVVRFDRETEQDVGPETVRRIVDRLNEIGESADAVILQDYNKGVLVSPVIRAAIELARSRGIPSVADPKFRRFFEYQGVHLFKPNAFELSAALGEPSAPREREGLRRARERLGCRHLLLTLAEKGMLLYGPGDDLHHIPAVARQVFDVSGAGDTVTATVAACLAAGGTELEAAIVANHAAALEVGKAGVVPVMPDELLASFEAK